MSNIADTTIDSTQAKIMTSIQAPVDDTAMASNRVEQSITDTTVHEMRNVLSRPVKIWEGSWNTTKGPLPLYNYELNGESLAIHTMSLPDDIFATSSVIVEKLSNFKYFKADIELELRVNSTHFDCGSLMMVFDPDYKYLATPHQRRIFLASQSSNPHVVLNLEISSAERLVIPFISQNDVWDLTKLTQHNVWLHCLSPLRSTSHNDVTVTVFARFLNPQWSVPTQEITLTSFVKKHTQNKLDFLNRRQRFHAQGKEEKTHHSMRTHKDHKRPHHARSDNMSGKSYNTGSQSSPSKDTTSEGEATGPVSRIANAVGTVATALEGVPIIGEVATGVSWLSRGVSQVASYFGWSKPTDLVMAQTYVHKPGYNMMHSEGKDHSTNLALIQDNSIDVSGAITEDVDEMNFKYIGSLPHYFARFTESTTTMQAGNLMHQFRVGPCHDYARRDGNLYLGAFTHMCAAARYWRGELVYDLTVIKTAYHTGRVLIVFLPQTFNDDVPATVGQLQSTNYSILYDLTPQTKLSQRNTVQVRVPYVNSRPWLRCGYEFSVDLTNRLDRYCSGTIAVYAITDLKRPTGTVSDQIEFLWAMSAGDDFEIAVPKITIAPDFVAPAEAKFHAQGLETRGPPLVPRFHAQGLERAEHIPHENILVPSVKPEEVKDSTIGEYFTSFRQLIKRCSPIATLNKNQIFSILGSALTGVSGNTIGIFKAQRSLPQYTPLATPFNPMVYTMHIYRYYAGGTRYKFVPQGLNLLIRTATQPVDKIESESNNLPELLYAAGEQFIQSTNTTGIVEVTLPYYSAVRNKLTSFQWNNAAFADYNPGGCLLNVQVDDSVGVGTSDGLLMLGASDDMSMFFLTGPPVMRTQPQEELEPIITPDTQYTYPTPTVTRGVASQLSECPHEMDGLDVVN